MRLSADERRIIRDEVLSLLGGDASITLFGSRADDTLRGGDVDLLVDVPEVRPHRVLDECALSARLHRRLGGRKVDVLIRDPRTARSLVHELADERGVEL